LKNNIISLITALCTNGKEKNVTGVRSVYKVRQWMDNDSFPVHHWSILDISLACQILIIEIVIFQGFPESRSNIKEVFRIIREDVSNLITRYFFCVPCITPYLLHGEPYCKIELCC